MEYTKKIAIFYPCSYEEYDDGKLQDSLERMEKSRPSSVANFCLLSTSWPEMPTTSASGIEANKDSG